MNINVYMGWDSREGLAFDVARNSIYRRTKEEVHVVPLDRKSKKLEGILTRPTEVRDGKLWCPISQAPMATDFAISRFCVPFLQRRGWALFCDCDIICLSDIRELFALADDQYAVMVVKHQQAVKEGETKMDGQVQTFYKRKNWSSVILWNCDHPSNGRLTIKALNESPGRDLHAFSWLEDSEIGELPVHWNWLVNVTPGEPQHRGIWHYTLGGPWFAGWKDSPHDEEWIVESGR